MPSTALTAAIDVTTCALPSSYTLCSFVDSARKQSVHCISFRKMARVTQTNKALPFFFALTISRANCLLFYPKAMERRRGCAIARVLLSSSWRETNALVVSTCQACQANILLLYSVLVSTIRQWVVLAPQTKTKQLICLRLYTCNQTHSHNYILDTRQTENWVDSKKTYNASRAATKCKCKCVGKLARSKQLANTTGWQFS